MLEYRFRGSKDATYRKQLRRGALYSGWGRDDEYWKASFGWEVHLLEPEVRVFNTGTIDISGLQSHQSIFE
jgi:hypothetical protein